MKQHIFIILSSLIISQIANCGLVRANEKTLLDEKPLLVDDASLILKEENVPNYNEFGIQNGLIKKYDYISPNTTDKTIIFEGDKKFSNTEQISQTQFKFYSGTPFYKDTDSIKLIETAETSINNFDIQLNELQFKQDELSFFSVPYALAQYDTGEMYSSAGDGRIYAGNADWSTVRSASTGTANPTNTEYPFSEGGLSGGTYYITRSFFPFDTSAIPDDAVINSVQFCLFSSASVQDNDQINPANGLLFEGTQASTTTLVGDDYDNLGTTLLSDTEFKLSEFRTQGYKCIVFNQSGKDIINKTGYTKLAIRPKNDYENQAPTNTSNFRGYYSEQPGVNYDPYLQIDYGYENYQGATPDSIPYNNELTLITGYEEIYTDSTTTPSEVRYIWYHIPFIAWIILAIPFFWIFTRVIMELIIRLRR